MKGHLARSERRRGGTVRIRLKEKMMQTKMIQTMRTV